ncbi:MAG: rod shape-determining protein MreC [Holosporaceae bacterium]|jgi:rod shape-determining protein MreC|nr:rod shape-determining protein MreC [Holosporaceae bacterium]
MAQKNMLQRNFIRRSRCLFKKLKTKKIALQLMVAAALLIMLRLSIAGNMINDLRATIVTIHVYIDNVFSCMEDCACEFIGYVANIGKIHRKLRKLQIENLKLQEENRNLSQLQIENTELRRFLSMTAKNDAHKVIVAKVVAKSSNNYTRSCVLGIGSADGVAADSIVKNSDGLIGQVVDVHKAWCRVLFITDIKSSIPVKIGKNSINAIASGNNSETLQITTVREDLAIHSGDTVTTSGYGNIFRDDIPVGKIIKNGNKFFVKPIIDFNRLTYGCILK